MRILALSTLLVFPFHDAVAAELACDGNPRNEQSTIQSVGSNSIDPPPGDSATVIDIGVQLMALSDIDVIRSRFAFEGYAVFTWCDPRQAFDASVEERPSKVFFGDKATGDYANIWIPDVSIANSTGKAVSTARRLEIHSDGTIQLSGFFNSVVATRFDLRAFPFDRQTLSIEMESFTFNRDVVQLRPIDHLVGFKDDLYLPEWQVKSVTASAIEEVQVRDRVPFSRVSFDVSIQRETGYYLFKLSVPLMLIVMLSWTVFWMKGESLAGRMRISSTAFLTIVAYQFAVSGSLPKVAYLTLMDKLMIASFFLIALTALENMVAVLMSERNPERASYLDRQSRWIFPLTYLATIVIVAVVAS